MKRLWLFSPLFLCAAGAIAQPSQNAGPGADRQAARDQRRAELRIAVQASRQIEAEAPAPRVYEPLATSRHLSPRERAEMRQQLRQQQPEGPRYKP